ncbi:MAG: tRNA-dihydrouridine synthase family protein [Desulfotalea sp.]
MILSLAPIRGLTDAPFRSLWAKHFNGFDFTIAPFINPQKKAELNDKLLKDIRPEANKELTVIPQLLNNKPEDFLALANRLADFGYKEINWNLGCPAPMVTKKKRGSGLLAHPDMILDMLDKVMPKLQLKLSVKTRLGFTDTSQTLDLLPKLNAYPLTEIIIHTRLGKQMYKGVTDPDTFAECLLLSTHRLAYNGDINSVRQFNELQTRFNKVEHWMIGRGALAYPFLPEEIRGKKLSNSIKIERLKNFHTELYEMHLNNLCGDSHVLGRMKMIWQYLALSFANEKKLIKKLNKCHNSKNFKEISDQILDNGDLQPPY